MPEQDSLSTSLSDQKENSKPLFLKKLKKIIKIVIFLVIIAVLFGLFYFLKENKFLIEKLTGKKDAWQAVFLTNGQVYFGKIVKETKDLLVLRKIYYLQFNQTNPINQGEKGEQLTFPPFSLVKLGNELHGPEDEMRINKAHVIFVENLKADSEVVKNIENFEKKK